MTRPLGKMGAAALALIVLGALAVCTCRSFPLSGQMLSRGGARGSLAQARVRILYKLNRGTFNVTRVRNSIRVLDTATGLVLGDRQYFSTDESCENKVLSHSGMKMVVESRTENGPRWETQFEIRIHPDSGNPALDRMLREGYGVKVTCRLVEPHASAVEHEFVLVGKARTHRSAFARRVAPGNKAIDASARPNDCLFDRRNFCVVHFAASNTAIGEPEKSLRGLRFPIRMRFASDCGIDFAENVPIPEGGPAASGPAGRSALQ